MYGPGKRKIKKPKGKCQVCGHEMILYRKDRKFCGERCRVKHFRGKAETKNQYKLRAELRQEIQGFTTPEGNPLQWDLTGLNAKNLELRLNILRQVKKDIGLGVSNEPK